MLMEDTGRAMERPAPLPAQLLIAHAEPPSPFVAWALLTQLLRLVALIDAAAVLQRVAAALRCSDWYLVSSAEHVAGAWLGLVADGATVWVQVDPTRLPSLLEDVALNDPKTVAWLSHERPWEAHATTLGALCAAAEGAWATRHVLLRVELASPDADGAAPEAVMVPTLRLAGVLEPLQALGEPARPVWCYVRPGDDGAPLLVLDGATWLVELDAHERGTLPPDPEPAVHTLSTVVSTIDPRHVGGRTVPLLSAGVH